MIFKILTIVRRQLLSRRSSLIILAFLALAALWHLFQLTNYQAIFKHKTTNYSIHYYFLKRTNLESTCTLRSCSCWPQKDLRKPVVDTCRESLPNQDILLRVTTITYQEFLLPDEVLAPIENQIDVWKSTIRWLLKRSPLSKQVRTIVLIDNYNHSTVPEKQISIIGDETLPFLRSKLKHGTILLINNNAVSERMKHTLEVHLDSHPFLNIQAVIIFGTHIIPSHFFPLHKLFGSPRKSLFSKNQMALLFVIKNLRLDHNFPVHELGLIRRTAVISADDRDYYAFYAPITARFWKLRIGMDVVLLAIGNKWKSHKSLKFISSVLEQIGVRIVYVSSPHGHNPLGLSTATIAQFSRLFAACMISDNPDDVVATADIDMIPLSAKSLLDDHWKETQLRFMNSNNWPPIKAKIRGEIKVIPHYPLSYVIAPTKIWKEIVNPNIKILPNNSDAAIDFVLDTIEKYLPDRQSLKEAIRQMGFEFFGNWFLDEYLLNVMAQTFIEEKQEQKQQLNLQLTPMECKMDRVCWTNKDFDISTDGHLMKQGYSEHVWVVLNKLWPSVLPPDDVEEIRNYRKQFTMI